MINIIKTAIITIIISFISGLLLDYYKNLAPKILCNIGNGIPVEINNKKVYAYIITVRNISNKIIHEINLHMQSPKSSLKVTDSKITKGLKFDSSIKDNILDIFIPFLSKDDEFSVTIYVENQDGAHNKPAVIIRSPENFKRVDSVEKKGFLSVFTNIPKNINEVISNIIKKDETTNKEIIHGNKKSFKKKKVMIIVTSIILVMIVGGVAKFYLKKASTKTQDPSVKTKVHEQSTDSKGSDGTTKNSDEPSTGGTNDNTDLKKPSTGGTNDDTDSKKPSTSGTNDNTDSKKPSTSGTNNNTDSEKPSTSGTNESTDSKKPSTGGTNENTDSKPSTDGTNGNTGN